MRFLFCVGAIAALVGAVSGHDPTFVLGGVYLCGSVICSEVKGYLSAHNGGEG